MSYKLPTKKQIAAYKKDAEQVLERLGFRPATPIQPDPEWNAFTPRDYELETVAGMLYCSINGDWLACVFWDVDKAKAHFGSDANGIFNPFSGKWNWYDLEGFESSTRNILVSHDA